MLAISEHHHIQESYPALFQQQDKPVPPIATATVISTCKYFRLGSLRIQPPLIAPGRQGHSCERASAIYSEKFHTDKSVPNETGALIGQLDNSA